ARTGRGGRRSGPRARLAAAGAPARRPFARAGVPRAHRHGRGGRMNRVRALAARELRAYFDSPIAYAFLVVFAGTAVFPFFNVEGLFARGIADLRGLFGPMPFLMILLVPALTMRLWAEERKQGTIEVLLTLPARDHELVAGKFLASWALLGGGLV